MQTNFLSTAVDSKQEQTATQSSFTRTAVAQMNRDLVEDQNRTIHLEQLERQKKEQEQREREERERSRKNEEEKRQQEKRHQASQYF